MECLSKKLLRNICHTRRHYSEILRLCPDITGSIIPKNTTDDTVDGSFNGAFYKLSSGGKGAWSVDDSENAQYGLGFRAGYSDSTYGQSSGVSVPACYALIIIKT